MSDPRGSNWRKWDLHIHTPASYEWKGEKYRSVTDEAQKDKLTRDVIEAIEKSDVAVFGIMDYWTFDGYLAIRRFLKNNPDITCTKTILPGIELRIESPTDYRMNIHVLLPDKLTDQQLYDFKSQLKIRGHKKNLSDEAIINAARDLGVSKAKEHGFSNPAHLSDDELLALGSMTIEISRESLNDAIAEVTDHDCIIIMPFDTYNGLEKLNWKRHPFADIDFMKLADIFETRKEENISLFLGIKTEKNDYFIDEFVQNMGGKPKLAISGSDAHSVSMYGVFPGDKITWIKADPTFVGLRQVLVEPRSRSFVGSLPPDISRVNSNKTKYLRSLRIERTPSNPSFDEIWFDNHVHFNHGLIAVIGNKGNGKSALVDIIALLSDYNRKEFLSFLHESKFRNPRTNKASHYTAYLTWENDTTDHKRLHEITAIDGNKIRYIPQHFFEQICNETEIKKESEFDIELKKVIFSHVQDYNRLACDSLDELIEYRTQEINQSIAGLHAQLNILNQQIVNLEEQLTSEYRQDVEQRLAAKQAELQSHENAQPEIVSEPTTVTDSTNLITTLRESLATATAKLEELNNNLEDNQRRLVTADKTLNLIASFRSQYQKFIRDLSPNLEYMGLLLEKTVTFDISELDVTEYKEARSEEQVVIKNAINSAKEEAKRIQEKIDSHQHGMEAAEKTYQQHLTDRTKWEQERNNIIGTEERSGTILYLQKKLVDIEKIIPSQLRTYEEERISLFQEIYTHISKLVSIYCELYSPVQNFIDNHQLIKDKYHLKFDVSISLRLDFIDKFLQKVRQNMRGPFYGREEGYQFLKNIMTKCNFNNKDDVNSFILEIISSLKGNNTAESTTKVLRSYLKNTPVEEFYNYLFGLTYLEPNYTLMLDNKQIPQLSPGERGILLLIFYLLVDGHDCPLIIDQPEENLDNQSIYELLVPCIEEAKQRRQILLVTHNANLAVVCDADQIIHASIDKSDGNKVSYISGAIENPEINRLLVNVLEGTWPAFIKRESMYHSRWEEYRRRFMKK